MAKDLPEYKRTTGITPLASPTGMATATQGVENSLQIYGALASQVASNAANERAQLAGITAAQNPRGTLLPAITQVDKTFRDSYREESAKVLSVQANKLLNDLTLEFSQVPNPTGSDLLKFQREAQQGLESLSNLADESIRPELNRAFMQKFDADSFALANRVQRADFERILDNFNISSQTNLENIYNYSILGMGQAAQDAYTAQINNLESMREHIGEDKYQQGLVNAKMSLDGAFYEHGLREAYDNKGELAAIEYLKNFEKNIPSGLTPFEHEQITGDLYKKLSSMQRIRATADDIEYAKAILKMEQNPDGTLSASDMDSLQYKVSTATFERIKLKQQIALNNLDSANLAGAFLAKNGGNRIALKDLSSSDLDAGFEANLKEIEISQGSMATLEQEAQLATSYDIAIPSFNKKLEGGITSFDPETAVTSSKLFAALRTFNPNIVEDIPNDIALRASLINSQIIRGKEPLKAVEYASEIMNGLTPEQIKERDDLFKEILNAKYRSPSAQEEFAKKSMGFDVENVKVPRGLQVPAGLTTDFINTIQSNFELSRDWDVSVNEAVEQLSRVYTKTNINGFDQVMFMAPDREIDTKIVQQLLKDDLAKLFEDQKMEALNNPNTLSQFYYEFNQEVGAKGKRLREPAGIGIGYVYHFPESDKINVTRVSTIDGSRLDGIIIISPDKFTPYSTDVDPEARDVFGQPLKRQPSYSIEFLPNDKKVAYQVYNPRSIAMSGNAYGGARFSVPSEEVSKFKLNKQKQLEKEAQDALARKKQLADMMGIIAAGEGID